MECVGLDTLKSCFELSFAATGVLELVLMC